MPLERLAQNRQKGAIIGRLFEQHQFSGAAVDDVKVTGVLA
jgi:hypothetical protein